MATLGHHQCLLSYGGPRERKSRQTGLQAALLFCPTGQVHRTGTKREVGDVRGSPLSPMTCSLCDHRKVIVAGDLNCSREAIDSAYIQDTPVRKKKSSLLLHSFSVSSRLFSMAVQRENG